MLAKSEMEMCSVVLAYGHVVVLALVPVQSHVVLDQNCHWHEEQRADFDDHPDLSHHDHPDLSHHDHETARYDYDCQYPKLTKPWD